MPQPSKLESVRYDCIVERGESVGSVGASEQEGGSVRDGEKDSDGER